MNPHPGHRHRPCYRECVSSPRRIRGSRRRRALYLLAAVAALIIVYDLVALAGERWEESHTPRIEGTPHAVGSEVLDLGPAEGSGAVLLVHGFIGGSNNFGALPTRLAQLGWRVRAMRLPGHGTTPRDFADETPESLLQGVRMELQELCARHDPVFIVGHSMGGALATLAAAEAETGLVDGLVLAAPAFGVAHRWWYGLRPETWTRLLAPIVPWVYKGDLFKQVNRGTAKPHIYSYRWVPTSGLVTLNQVSARARRPSTLERITCPVLLIHSRGDIAADFTAATEALAGMAGRRKETLDLDRSNHHLFWDHERERVISTIETFLGRAPE